MHEAAPITPARGIRTVPQEAPTIDHRKTDIPDTPPGPTPDRIPSMEVIRNWVDPLTDRTLTIHPNIEPIHHPATNTSRRIATNTLQTETETRITKPKPNLINSLLHLNISHMINFSAPIYILCD